MKSSLFVPFFMNLLACDFGKKVSSVGVSLVNMGEAGVTILNTKTLEQIQVSFFIEN